MIKINGKKKANTYGLVVLLWVISSVMVVTPSGAAGPPVDCHYTAYTADYSGNHYSLLKNNSVLIGQDFIIETNCDIAVDTGSGFLRFSNIQTYTTTLSLDTDVIRISFTDGDNLTSIDSYESLTVYPAGFNSIWEDYESRTTVRDVTVYMYDTLAVFGISELITFFFATTIISRIAVYHADREEVVVV